MSDMRIQPGRPYPLGADFDGRGTNFALFSRNAERVELCFFSADGMEETARVELPEYTDEVWHCYIPGVKPGQLYGYRVYGRYDPKSGHRFNGNKLLIDPYAKSVFGKIVWSSALFPYRMESPERDLSFDGRDSARFMPKCVVVGGGDYAWRAGKPGARRSNSVIYELHVKGATKLHPSVPENIRGTFAGLAHESVIGYLKDLGITAVEIMPAQCFFLGSLPERNRLYNYWGYNTINFFTPEPAYLSGGGLDDFRGFVDKFHAAGLEVIMDVVYNHTSEGSHMGPMFSLRGIDNAYYYRLAKDRRYYDDATGVGNALDFGNQRVVQLAMDSLRYWADDMRVDGFRFDLAVSLGRAGGVYSLDSNFLGAIAQDPVLQKVKKIAEPWDVGPDGYKLGCFPVGWSEWNDRYRDTARRFWRGDDGRLGDMATRFTGSSELFERQGRRPWSTLNFITSHDGFTMNDLVSYGAKHNEANGEGNRDGAKDNASSNYGVEGPAEDPCINETRLRQMKNMFATLVLSQGLPMILGGDEFARTQIGNNNAYPQDNRISWLDWSLLEKNRGLYDFVKMVIALRRAHIVFRRSKFFKGQTIAGAGTKDITWLSPGGAEFYSADWNDPKLRTLVFRLSGDAGDNFHLDKSGRALPDDDFYAVMNADVRSVDCSPPAPAATRGKWRVVFDTADDGAAGHVVDGRLSAAPRSFVLLVSERGKN